MYNILCLILDFTVIKTVAGDAGKVRLLDGGLATLSLLRYPISVAVDASGNIYIADANDHRVRMVTKSTGIITTVAGNGLSGYSGDGGLATTARLSSPFGVTVDASGNIYIIDSGNHCIPMVTRSTGNISTVGGGDGGLTTSGTLSDTAVDESGNIYIADTGSDCIRMVTMSNGIVSTVAGTGTFGYSGDGGLLTSAEFRGPSGVAVDASGNIYIADTNNHRVRMVTISNGIVSILAGTGLSGYSGDGGLAASAKLGSPRGVAVDASGNIYIADAYNECIRMVAKSTGIITTVAGYMYTSKFEGSYSGDGGLATSARLSYPYGVTVDASGNIYIADTFNNRIRMVTKSTGIITTVAGNGLSGYSGDSGDGGLATSARLSSPSDVAVDASGNIYIADADDHRIRMVTKSTGIITTVAGDATSGYSGDGGLATLATVNDPIGVAFDVSGNIYIADSGNSCIRMIAKSTGIITTVAGIASLYRPGTFGGDGGLATSAKLSAPCSVAVDASGNIYIADSGNHCILMVTTSTGIITTLAGNGTAGYGGDGGQATSTSLFGPSDVAVDASGNIYIADSDNNRIRMVMMSTGIITTVAGNGTFGYSGDGGLATSARLSSPSDVAVDALGNIYIADTDNGRIRMVMKSTGIVTTVAGNGLYSYSGDGGLATSAALFFPDGITVDASGNIYIIDSGNHCIRMVTKSTGIISTLAGNKTAGYSGDGGQAKLSLLNKPSGVAIDASGNIYVCDTGNNRLRVLLVAGVSSTSTTNSPTATPNLNLTPTPSPNTIPTPTPTPTPTPSPSTAPSASSSISSFVASASPGKCKCL
jgi:trimeric autotransporter adhesin